MPEGDKTIINRPRRPAMFMTYNRRARRPKEYKMSKARRPAILVSFPRTINVDEGRVGRRNDHAIHDLMYVADTLSDQTRV